MHGGFLLALLVAGIGFCLPCKAAYAQQHAASEAAHTLTFNTGHELPVSAVLNSVFAEACRRFDYRCTVNAYPSQRALVLSNTEGDGEAARVKNIRSIAAKDTSNLILVPQSSVTMELAVFTKGLALEIDGWESLEGYRNSGRLGAKIIEKNLPADSLFLTDNDQLFRMLDSGRVDTVIEWKCVGLKTIKDLNLTGITVMSTPLQVSDFYPFLHVKHKELVPTLADAIASMKADGTYEAIRQDVMTHYGLASQEKP